MSSNQNGSHRTVEDFISSKNIGLPVDLSSLGKRGRIIGYDGNKVLADLLKYVREKDPTALLTSTVPAVVFDFVDHLKTVIETLTSTYEVRVVMVFDGCGFAPLPSSLPQPLTVPARICEGGDGRSAQEALAAVGEDVRAFVRDSFEIGADLEDFLVLYLKQVLPCQVIRAPYLAWAQLASMLHSSNQFVYDLVGCVELLAFPGVDSLITDINLETGKYKNINKRDLATKIGQAFRDFSVDGDDLAGALLFTSLHRQFRVHTPERIESFTDFCRIQRQSAPSRTEHVVCTAKDPAPFKRNLAATSAPVLVGATGHVVPLNELLRRPSTCDSIATTFGDRAPPLYYSLMAFSPICPEVLGCVLHHAITDRGPYPLPLTERTHAIFNNVKVHILHHVLATCPAIEHFLRWVRHDSAQDFKQPNIVALAEWFIAPQDVLELTDPDGLVWFNVVDRFAQSAAPQEAVVSYDGVQATVAAVLMKSLDFLGYFTHSLTPEIPGEPLSDFFPLSQSLAYFDCKSLIPYGVLVIELARAGVLDGEPVYGEPGSPVVAVAPGARFACRLLSVVTVNTSGAAASEPISVDLLHFTPAARHVNHTLRMLVVTIAQLLFVENPKKTTLPYDQFDLVVQQLPFAAVPDMRGGAVMEYILARPDCTLDDLRAAFPSMYCLEEDLGVLFWFWSMAFQALDFLSRRATSPESGDTVLPLRRDVLLEAHLYVASACHRLSPDMYTRYYLGYISPEVIDHANFVNY